MKEVKDLQAFINDRAKRDLDAETTKLAEATNRLCWTSDGSSVQIDINGRLYSASTVIGMIIDAYKAQQLPLSQQDAAKAFIAKVDALQDEITELCGQLAE